MLVLMMLMMMMMLNVIVIFTGKYGSSTHIGYSINIKLNQKITVEFHNLKNYDSHLIMQELIKFNLKKNKMLYQTD